MRRDEEMEMAWEEAYTFLSGYIGAIYPFPSVSANLLLRVGGLASEHA